jgi:hypothetical protein
MRAIIFDVKHRAMLIDQFFCPANASISASVGKRPVAFLENFSWPLTAISNTPPLDRTSSASVPVSSRSLAPARRALGS